MSYRYMRLLLMFDMPTDTASDRKAYRKFRKFLINEGFYYASIFGLQQNFVE